MKIKKKYQNYKKIKKKEVKFTIFIRNINYFIKIFIVLIILFVATKNIGINNLRNSLLDIREKISIVFKLIILKSIIILVFVQWVKKKIYI